MFPYDELPVSKLGTSLDIERYGYQALLRALNIGRVVAFVGSGTSLNFGQPSWDDFRDRASKLFFALENCIAKDDHLWVSDSEEEAGTKRPEFKREFRNNLTGLAREIKELAAGDEISQSHFVGLCETYFEEVEQLLKKHGCLKEETEDLLDQAKKMAGTDNPNKYSRHKPLEWVKQEYGPHIEDDEEFENVPQSLSDFRTDFTKPFQSLKNGNLRKAKTLEALLEKLHLVDKKTDLRTVIPKLISAFDEFGLTIENLDVARALRTRAGVRRFLTLNYDLELERMLLEEGRSAPMTRHEFFQRFVDQDNFDNSEARDYDQGKGRAVSLLSPSGRIIRSTSSRKETLADLFSFGAFPTNFDASVHHLHGRVDDPKNIIITPADYQKIYYGKSEQKKSFDEARHAVFTGSDLFVVGMGTKESDVLKPLRDFLELEADRRDAFGRVYYVTRSKLSGEKDFRKDFWKSRVNSMALTQQLYQDYEMHTLLIDQSFDVETRQGWLAKGADTVSPEDEPRQSDKANLLIARSEIAYYVKQIKKGNNPEVQNCETRCAQFEEVFGKESGGKGDHDLPCYHFAFEDLLEARIARKVVEKLNGLKADQALWEKAEPTVREILNTLESRLISRGLVAFVDAVVDKRREWWGKWSQLPDLRCAVYGAHHYRRVATDNKNTFEVEPPTAGEPTAPLVWRQSNMMSRFADVPLNLGNDKLTPQFTGFIETTRQAREAAIAYASGLDPDKRFPTKWPAAIARISIPPGGGKGRLLSFFTSPQDTTGTSDTEFPFQRLFSGTQPIPGEKKETYIGCYAVHLTFALEFSSIMVGLGRFLQQLLPQLEESLKTTGDPQDLGNVGREEWTRFKNHQFQEASEREPILQTLADMFAFLKAVCPAQGWNKRVIAFFSYLDRLVDENGDAHSTMHRAFFRLISGWGDRNGHLKLPIDFVFVNCHANRPIRYLSIEESFGDDEYRNDQKWQPPGWAIRKDRKIALQHWNEMPRVKIPEVVHEALGHAVSLTHRYFPTPNGIPRVKQIWEWIGGEERPIQAGSTKTEKVLSPELPVALTDFLHRRVVFGHMFAGLANEVWLATRAAGNHENAFGKIWQAQLSTLAAAYTRESSRGFFDELLAIYRRLDRQKAEGERNESFRTGMHQESLKKERLRALIVDHLALFAHPTSVETLRICPDIAALLRTMDDPEIVLGEELTRLVSRGLAARYTKTSRLIHRVDASKDDAAIAGPGDFLYGLDTKLTSALRARANLSIYDHYNLVPFQPSLYPSQPEHSIKPDFTHFKRVSEVVRALVKPTHRDLVLKLQRPDLCETKDEFAIEFERCSDRLRAAYALIRGTFSISVISRLSERHDDLSGHVPYDEYRTWTRKLLNTSTLMTKYAKRYRDCYPDEAHAALPFNQPFFRDEVCWLFNERALVSFVQGRLFDALPLFGQAIKVLGTSHKQSSDLSFKSTHRRIQINAALAQLERGNISTAQDVLKQVIRETQPRWPDETPSTVNCFARGYLALCQHLTDDFTRAQAGYLDVIKELEQLGIMRGQCIFRRHYADLLRAMSKSRKDEEFSEAINQLRSAEELAMGLGAADLQNYTLIAQARLSRDMQQRSEALAVLRHAEEFARRMGVQKMLTEVLKVRGEVLLDDGETTQGGFVTAQSIAMSKRNGMRLRKISASLIQSQILKTRGQKKDAIRLLRETISESQTLGYATKTSQAMNLLSELT